MFVILHISSIQVNDLQSLPSLRLPITIIINIIIPVIVIFKFHYALMNVILIYSVPKCFLFSFLQIIGILSVNRFIGLTPWKGHCCIRPPFPYIKLVLVSRQAWARLICISSSLTDRFAQSMSSLIFPWVSFTLRCIYRRRPVDGIVLRAQCPYSLSWLCRAVLVTGPIPSLMEQALGRSNDLAQGPVAIDLRQHFYALLQILLLTYIEIRRLNPSVYFLV